MGDVDRVNTGGGRTNPLAIPPHTDACDCAEPGLGGSSSDSAEVRTGGGGRGGKSGYRVTGPISSSTLHQCDGRLPTERDVSDLPSGGMRQTIGKVFTLSQSTSSHSRSNNEASDILPFSLSIALSPIRSSVHILLRLTTGQSSWIGKMVEARLNLPNKVVDAGRRVVVISGSEGVVSRYEFDGTRWRGVWDDSANTGNVDISLIYVRCAFDKVMMGGVDHGPTRCRYQLIDMRQSRPPSVLIL